MRAHKAQGTLLNALFSLTHFAAQQELALPCSENHTPIKIKEHCFLKEEERGGGARPGWRAGAAEGAGP